MNLVAQVHWDWSLLYKELIELLNSYRGGMQLADYMK